MQELPWHLFLKEAVAHCRQRVASAASTRRLLHVTATRNALPPKSPFSRSLHSTLLLKQHCCPATSTYSILHNHRSESTTMSSKQITAAFLMAAAAVSMPSSEAFVAPKHSIAATRVAPLFEATGGWGIGQSRDITPEEYAKGDRRAFEGYELTERGDFMRNVKDEQSMMKRAEMDELLGVAKIAGINVKNPSERLNKFEPDVFGDDEEDIDLSV